MTDSTKGYRYANTIQKWFFFNRTNDRYRDSRALGSHGNA